MFFKLIKHNLKAIFKSILPFIIAFFASVIFFNITDYNVEYVLRDDYTDVIVSSEICYFLHGFAQFFLYCSLILLAASTLKAVWRRFSSNFYSDEAYLTHTLPVSRTALWNAQICSIIITFVSILIFLILNCFILLLTRDGQRTLESLGLLSGCASCIGNYYHIEPQSFSLYFSIISALFIEFIFMTLCGMTGIILKNRFGKNIAVLSGVLIYSIGCAIIFYLGFFVGEPYLTGKSMQTVLFSASTIYLIYSIILYFVDQKLLQHGINLD